MALFRWQDIDHRLGALKLTDLGVEMRDRIAADERRIRFENRLNMNINTAPYQLLRMRVARADEWAERMYEIYCAVWQTQGYVKSPAFVRNVAGHVVQMLGARASAMKSEFSGFARRTSFPGNLTTAHLKGIDLQMRQLQGRWQRRLEIEARECEHAERQRTVSHRTKRPAETASELFRQVSAAGEQRETRVSEEKPRPRPGRSSKRAPAFVACAGTLWRKAFSDGHTHVSDDRLQQIASALDDAGHLPPSDFLEERFAQELKAFNSRNSRSGTGPVKTWSQLISVGDKDHLRGMRRLLSRCAKKLDGHPLSGN